MEAVLALLSQSIDQSNASGFPGGQPMEMMGEEQNDESLIEHEGKRYQRITIEGLEAKEGEYLMDEEQNIYNLNYEFITNMNNE